MCCTQAAAAPDEELPSTISPSDNCGQEDAGAGAPERGGATAESEESAEGVPSIAAHPFSRRDQ